MRNINIVIKTAVASLLLYPMVGVSGVTQTGGDSMFSQLRKNAEYTLESSVLIFHQEPGSNYSSDSDDHFLIRQSMKSQANISDNWTLDMDLRLVHTSESDDYAGIFRKPGTEERHGESLDFNALFLTYASDDYDVIVGKEVIDVGVAESNSPTNRFGLVDGTNPMHAEKFGVWHIGLNYYIEDDTLSFKAIPFHERSMIPQKRSRWLGSSPDADFRTITLPAGLPAVDPTIEDEFHDGSLDDWGYLLEYKGVREGYDFFGLIHHGPSIYPVLKQVGGALSTDFEKIDPQAWSFGGGISKVVDEWTYYAEGIYQVTEGDKDDDFLRYSFGFTYRDTEFANSIGLQEIKPFVELSGDKTTSEQSADGYLVSSKEARPFNEAIAMRVEIQVTDKWSYALGTVYNYDAGDRSNGIGAEYRPNDNTKINAVWTHFTGDEDTHFGRWSQNNNIEVGFEYKF